MILLLRGMPGSGKSTLAKTFNVLHLEADQFVMHDGKYDWKPETLKASHAWCYRTFMDAVLVGMDVVVSNTFTTFKEISPYIDFCREQKVPYKIIRCVGDYDNVHNVPQYVITQMKSRMCDITEEVLYYS